MGDHLATLHGPWVIYVCEARVGTHSCNTTDQNSLAGRACSTCEDFGTNYAIACQHQQNTRTISVIYMWLALLLHTGFARRSTMFDLRAYLGPNRLASLGLVLFLQVEHIRPASQHVPSNAVVDHVCVVHGGIHTGFARGSNMIELRVILWPMMLLGVGDMPEPQRSCICGYHWNYTHDLLACRACSTCEPTCALQCWW
jgi:hypothetical protein